MKKLLLAGLVAISLAACKDREEKKPDCGCDSEIVNTISESQNATGKIAYKLPADANDHFYVNKFWIIVEIGAIVSNYIICNESLLPNEILQLKNTGESLKVKFSGEVKKTCESITAPSTISYQNITLTKIELR